MPDAIIQLDQGFWIGTGTASADRNLSNRLLSVTWTEKFDDHDVTVMGSTTRVRAIGLGESNIKAEFMHAYSTADAAENLDAIVDTLRTVSQNGGRFLVRVRSQASVIRGATNPEYQMACVMAERTIVDGSVGDVLKNPITFLSADSVRRFACSS
jgi:hypothetical protein